MEGGKWKSFWQQLERHEAARENHTQTRKDHAATYGGWNMARMALTEGWEAKEGHGVARRI